MLNTHAQPPTSHAPTKRSAAAPPATRGWGGMAEEGAAAAAVERARRAAWTSATGATDAGRGWVARTTVEKARQASGPAIARAVGANADAKGTPAEARYVAEDAAAAAAVDAVGANAARARVGAIASCAATRRATAASAERPHPRANIIACDDEIRRKVTSPTLEASKARARG